MPPAHTPLCAAPGVRRRRHAPTILHDLVHMAAWQRQAKLLGAPGNSGLDRLLDLLLIQRPWPDVFRAHVRQRAAALRLAARRKAAWAGHKVRWEPPTDSDGGRWPDLCASLWACKCQLCICYC